MRAVSQLSEGTYGRQVSVSETESHPRSFLYYSFSIPLATRVIEYLPCLSSSAMRATVMGVRFEK